MKKERLHRTHLPSYEEAVAIYNNYETSTFYENKYVVNGYNVSLFNYRLAQYMDFVDPLGKGEIDARELRGLCFIFNKDGTVFKRYLLLEKFFNIDQTEESLYEVVKNYEIKYINNKEDGSVASFVRFPDGKVIGKSKMGFDSTQAIGATKLYEKNEGIKNFVNYCLSNNIIAVFEYVSPRNRIVLNYKEEKLILLKLRDNKTGKYLDIHDYLDIINENDIEYAEFEDIESLDRLLEINETDENKEGYVIHAIDDNGHDFFYKIKNEWYRSRHGLLTDEIRRENMIIKYILDDTIDDLLGEIPKDETITIDRINAILEIVRTELKHIVDNTNMLYDVLTEVGDVKTFALEYHKNIYFPAVMAKYNSNRDPYDFAIDMISKQTNFLEIARKWLDDRGYKYEKYEYS